MKNKFFHSHTEIC